MEVGLDPLQTAGGIGLGIVADRAYAALNLPDNRVAGIPFEHTHVGLASLILGLDKPKLTSVATGFGLTLIIEDAVPGPSTGNWFGLYNPTDPNDPVFVMGFYAIEVGVLTALASRQRRRVR